MHSNLVGVVLKVSELFLTPKKLSTKEFLETEYRLPDFGNYDFYYTPYFLAVALALDDEEIGEINLMKAAQIGWTYFLLGYIFKRISEADFDTCPIMALFAKSGDGKNFHDEKLVPAVEATQVINRLLDVSTSRKTGNRWDNKSFPGGFLKLVGSNSPGNVKSTSKVGVGIVEEPDDTQDNVAGQGDAIGLLEERLKRYIGSKLIVGGTPAVKGLSKTEDRLKKTDQRILPIKCHECGNAHPLNWANVIWDTDVRDEPHPVYGYDDPASAIYVCPHCGIEWDDNQRQNNIRNTCFDAYNSGDPLAGWKQTAEFFGRAGFMGLSELYVCMPGTSLSKVVEEYIAAVAAAEQGDQKDMIKFINQKLGEAYEYKDNNATAEELKAKAEDYPELIVPRKALFLTMGIDIQRDRVAVTIYAWGPAFENWIIYWGEIWAATNLNDINDPVWTELDKLLFGRYLHESGATLTMLAASLDTSDGVTQGATYHYVRSRSGEGVNLMAIKGANTADAPAVTVPRKHDLNVTQTKADKYGLKIWKVGTQIIKDELAGALKLEGQGPARVHIYRDIRKDFFEQMTGEIKAPSKSARNHSLMWQKKAGAAVEAWDCSVYARHAALVEKLHIKQASWWRDKEGQLLQADLLGSNDDHASIVKIVDERPDVLDIEVTEVDQTINAPVIPVLKQSIKKSETSSSQAQSLEDLGRLMG
jgi:phage terminase large subunit GpA-like protein